MLLARAALLELPPEGQLRLMRPQDLLLLTALPLQLLQTPHMSIAMLLQAGAQGPLQAQAAP